jgi:multidrug efflux pump subunit AcrB
MNLLRYFVKNHVLVNMITIGVVLLGVLLTMKLNREVMPSISYGSISIRTAYPGASPEEVERVVTTPFEEAIAGMPGIKTLESESREGTSDIDITADSGIEGAALDQLLNDIKNKVGTVQDIPADVETPEFEKSSPNFSVVTVTLSGDAPEETLRAASDRLKAAIEAIDGIDSVERDGYRNREVWVSVNPLRLEAANLSMAAVVTAIRNRNLNVPGGTIDVGPNEVLIRTIGEVEGPADVGNVIVRSLAGGVVRVRDVSDVTETYKKRDVIGRINGKPSINLQVNKTADGDIIKIVAEIRKLVQEEKSILPPGVKIDMVRDNSVVVQKRQKKLFVDGIVGLILVLIIMYLILDAKIALWSAASIPFSFLLSLIVMYYMGITLNLLSMFGLILVLGMVVDQAIVVAENSFRYREMGLSMEESVLTGTHEVILPVAAAVTTHIASLLPLMFTSGIMGKYLKVIPVVGIICFLASWFQAFFILPSNLNQFVKISVSQKKEDFRTWFNKVRDFYGELLSYALKRRYLIFIGLNVVAVATMIFGFLTMEFVWMGMGRSTDEQFNISIRNPINTNLNQTDRVMKKLEKVVMDLPSDEVASVVTSVGRGRGETGGYLGRILVELTEKGYKKVGTEQIINSLRKELALIPGPTSITVQKQTGGPPTGSPVSVEIKGEDFVILEKLSEQVMNELRTIKGVTDIENNYQKGKDEYRIVIDEYKAKTLGLDVAKVAAEVRNAFSGGNAGNIRRGDEKIDIVVKYDDLFQNPIYLMNFTVPNPSGENIPIRSFANIVDSKGIFKIYHSERKRTITVTADIIGDENTSAGVTNELMKKFGTASTMYPGYFFSYTGEYQDTQESLRSMIEALWIVLLIIYTILAVLFRSFVQPVIIMFAIPFAFIGVFFGLFVMGEQLSLFAFIGVIALMGIVVSNSILLLDFINRARAAGRPLYEAVKESGMVRLRPILLTSLTILMGLFPMAFAIGGREQLLTPMAVSMFWGILFSTMLTLFVVPCLYVIVEDIKGRYPRIFKPGAEPGR